MGSAILMGSILIIYMLVLLAIAKQKPSSKMTGKDYVKALARMAKVHENSIGINLRRRLNKRAKGIR